MAKKYEHNKGEKTSVDPIRELEDIQTIKRLLRNRPRDLALFTIGINTNLRASDLLRITVGQVRGRKAGEMFGLQERKTKKSRPVHINQAIESVVAALIPTLANQEDDAPLFQSQKGQRQLTTTQLYRLVREWCDAANIEGNFGSHTLRKTWGHTMYKHHGAELPALMEAFEHSSQKITLRYIGLDQKVVTDLFAINV